VTTSADKSQTRSRRSPTPPLRPTPSISRRDESSCAAFSFTRWKPSDASKPVTVGNSHLVSTHRYQFKGGELYVVKILAPLYYWMTYSSHLRRRAPLYPAQNRIIEKPRGSTPGKFPLYLSCVRLLRTADHPGSPLTGPLAIRHCYELPWGAGLLECRVDCAAYRPAGLEAHPFCRNRENLECRVRFGAWF
jgi:hypothetical protein